MKNLVMEKKLKAIANRYGILALYVFGSRAEEIAAWARGQVSSLQCPHSDVDIGVYPAPERYLTAKERIQLSIEIEDLLGARFVDLIVLPEADPFLALEVIRGELLFCADADIEGEYELYVLRRAADLAFYARERWQNILMERGR